MQKGLTFLTGNILLRGQIWDIFYRGSARFH